MIGAFVIAGRMSRRVRLEDRVSAFCRRPRRRLLDFLQFERGQRPVLRLAGKPQARVADLQVSICSPSSVIRRFLQFGDFLFSAAISASADGGGALRLESQLLRQR
jgi:hypothetical protein